MSDITDPQYLRFINERLRPMCEKLRNLDLELQAIKDAWDGGIKQLVSGNLAADPIADGRESEGVSRLTKKDATDAIAVMTSVEALMSATAQIRKDVNKPCVRAPRIS